MASWVRKAWTSDDASIPGGVALDSFSGSTDDDKLTAALAYAAAQTRKPAVFIGNRDHFFAQQRDVYPGLKVLGLGGFGDQHSASNQNPNRLVYTGSGTWWSNPNSVTKGVEFRGLTMVGNPAAQFIASNPGVLWTSKFTDLGFTEFGSVFGNDSNLSTTKFLNNACIWTGWGNINNTYGTSCVFGGSDSVFFTGGQWLIDSPTTKMVAGKYHVIFDYQEESTVENAYVSCEQSGGVLINGGATTKGLRFTAGFSVEGRNAGAPCYGSLVRVNGGGVTFRDSWLAYGATNLNANGRSGELGVITVAGANADVFLDGVHYDRAAAESALFVGLSAGACRVRNVRRGAKGGSWSGLPRVSAACDSDNSVTEV